jgi:hypothetical protein
MFRSILKAIKSVPNLRSKRKEQPQVNPPLPTPIPTIIVSSPTDDHDLNNIKPQPFSRFSKRQLDKAPLPELFPNLFYKP